MAQVQNTPGFFAGIGAAEARPDANYLRPGNYTLELTEAKAIKTRKGRAAFVVEARVVEGTGDGCNGPGDVVSHMVMMDTDGALSDVKGFAAAATGLAFDSVDEAGMTALVCPDQPLRGRTVLASARVKVTAKGVDFTKVTYSPDPAQAPLGAKGPATGGKGAKGK